MPSLSMRVDAAELSRVACSDASCREAVQKAPIRRALASDFSVSSLFSLASSASSDRQLTGATAVRLFSKEREAANKN